MPASALPAPATAYRVPQKPPGPTPIVVVLGMHRSGTSLCSHVLSLCGIDMAAEAGAGRGNDDGHWERWEIVEWHDRILALLGRGYFSGSHDLPLSAGWWADPEIRKVRLDIEAFLQTRIKAREPFGFKDPRTARLLPLWNQIYRSLDLSPKYVVCVRSPNEVAQSLFARDGTGLDIGEYRWLVYNSDIFHHLSQRFFLVDYDSWFDDAAATVTGLAGFLGVTLPVDGPELSSAVEDIVKPSLRHAARGPPHARSPAIRLFYDLIRAGVGEQEPNPRMAGFANQFLAFQRLLPVGARLELKAGDADERGREISALRDQLTAREHAFAEETRLRESALARLRDEAEVAAARERALEHQVAECADVVARLRAELAGPGSPAQGLTAQQAAIGEQLVQLRAERDEAAGRAVGAEAGRAALAEHCAALTREIDAARAREAALGSVATEGASIVVPETPDHPTAPAALPVAPAPPDPTPDEGLATDAVAAAPVDPGHDRGATRGRTIV